MNNLKFLQLGLFLIYSLSFFNYSCKSDVTVPKHSNVNNFKVTLNLVKSDSIPLDSNTYNEFLPFDIISYKGEDCIFFNNKLNQSVDIYSKEKRKLVNRIKPLDNESSRFESMTGYIFYNEDSILLVNRLIPGRSIVVNNGGKIIDRSPVYDDIPKDVSTFKPKHTVFHNNLYSFKYRDFIYFLTYSSNLDTQYEIDQKTEYNLIYKYDLKVKQYTTIVNAFPEWYHHKHWPSEMTAPSIAIFDDRLLIQWPNAQKIEAIHLKNDTKSILEVPSNPTHKIYNGSSIPLENYGLKEFMESENIFAIKSDTLHDLILRIITHPITYSAKKHGDISFSIFECPFSIEILTDTGVFITDYYFEPLVYDYSRTLVHNGNLYLCRDNLMKEYDRRLFRYDIYKINKSRIL